MPTTRPYVGHAQGRRHYFRSASVPNRLSNPEFVAVIGPFRTAKAARFCADHPNSPLCTVSEFERHCRTF